MFIRHQITENTSEHLSISLYLDSLHTEFAKEFGTEGINSLRFRDRVYAYMKQNFPQNTKKTYVTILSGVMTVSSLVFSPDSVQAAESGVTNIDTSKPFNMGYLFYGSSSMFVDEVDAANGVVSHVSPSFFEIDSTGNLTLTWQFNPSFMDQMHQRGVKVVPYLSNNWDQGLGRLALANRQTLAKQIADTVNQYNMDGVNIDIENLTEVDRGAYTDFIKTLKSLLPNKEVSVAVAANPYNWKVGWQASYDYKALSDACDYLFLMAYDETSQGDAPGPVASYGFVDKSIQYALNQGVPPAKLVLGIPSYGRYWKQGEATGGYGITDFQIEQMLSQYQNTVVYDTNTHSSKATVTINAGDPPITIFGKVLSPGTYTIWFENDQTVSEQAALAKSYNLKGTGEWSLGLETPSFWNAITGEATTASVATTSQPPQTISPPSTYTVQSGDSLSVIAVRFNTTVSALKSANNLTSDLIFVGQVLTLPQASVATPQATTQLVRTDKTTIGLFVNGKEYFPDVPPFIQNNRTLVPIRAIAEALGATVTWNSTTNTVLISMNGKTITMKEFSNVAYVNGKQVLLDQPALVRNNRTMVPVRFISEAFGYNVRFDNELNSVIVESPSSSAPTTSSVVQPVTTSNVQQSLTTLGYNQASTQSVSSFQSDYGLPVTGTADSVTSLAIQHALVKQSIVSDVGKYVGVPYKWGGADPSGFDCSGFIYYMFSTHGISTQRTTSASLFNQGTPIAKSNLMPGDLVFFAINTPGVISHVGIYVGNNQFISATSSKGVQYVSMDNPYWAPKYVGAKRVY